MSAPAEKARSPAPVSTTTRTSRSASIAVQMRCNSRSDATSMAFSTSGRSMVTRATWSATAKRIGMRRLAGRPDARAFDLGEHLGRVLAEIGRRNANGNRRILEMDRRADDAHAFDVALALDDHAVDRRLLIRERLGERAHRRTEKILFLEPREPIRRRVALEALAEDPMQRRLVLGLQRMRLEARIVRERREPERLADVTDRIGLE